MNERILFVDDEKNVLATFRRTLHGKFTIDTAEGASAALSLITSTGPYAVIVSDLKMPLISGVEFLGMVKKKWPETIRIMLTGQGDLDSAMAAVNQGAIFRFLTKPCSLDVVQHTLEDALRQYRLVMSEKELLRGTLRGCIRMMSELLSVSNPDAFGRGERGKVVVDAIARMLNMEDEWRFEMAAMLSQIGCVSLPQEILEKKLRGEGLGPEEQQIFLMHPMIGGELLRNIPRLGIVADMVEQHEWPLSKEPCLGARILKVALDYADAVHRGTPRERVVAQMRSNPDVYDPHILDVLEKILARQKTNSVIEVPLSEAREGMILAEDVHNGQGHVLLRAGQSITMTTLEWLTNFATIVDVRGPLKVFAPAAHTTTEKENRPIS